MTQPMAPSLRAISLSVAVCMARSFSGEKAQCNQYNRTLDAARADIANRPVAIYERIPFGLFLVALKETGTPIGICGLLKRETLNDIDIGFAFLPAHWSRGYAIESAMGVKAWATAELGVKRLVAIVLPANTSSIRLLEKMDFRAETTIRLTDCGDELLLYGCALD